MAYQVLARKWRPKVFADLIGQEHIAKTLQNSIEQQRVGHAYLFTGVRGVGKTTTARILATALNCEQGPTATPCGDCSYCQQIVQGSSMDVHEIDGASNTGVDDVRDLKESIQYLPAKGKYKIYIIDEVHMLSKAAFNALLKTLEEPPDGVIFIFATTEPHRLPDTILSRCQRFDFKRVGRDVIAKRLSHIAQAEQVEVSEGSLQAVAAEAQGSVRDALTLMDRLISHCGKKIEDTQARELLGLVDRNSLRQLLKQVMSGSAADAVKSVHQIYYAGFDLKRLLESLIEELRNALLLKVGVDAESVGLSGDEAKELTKLFAELSELEIERYFEITKKALFEIGRVEQEHYLLESTVIRLSHVHSDLLEVRQALDMLQGKKPAVMPKPSPEPRREVRREPKSESTAEAKLEVKTATKAEGNAAKKNVPDTIEDAYVKETVGLFGAKVEKIQIQGSD